MKDYQLKALKELEQDPDFKGRKSLHHIIWLNTVEPKYHVGECFKVTEPHRMVLGSMVENFNAMITKVHSNKNSEEWIYTLEAEVKNGTSETQAYFYVSEQNLTEKVEGNINII